MCCGNASTNLFCKRPCSYLWSATKLVLSRITTQTKIRNKFMDLCVQNTKIQIECSATFSTNDANEIYDICMLVYCE